MNLDPTVAKFFIVAVLAVAVYALVYLPTKLPKINRNVPNYRSRPQVITKDGLKTMVKTTILTPNRYMVEFHDGTKEKYTKTDTFDSLRPLYPTQIISGENAPVYIEHDYLVALSEGYEHAPTRELMKIKLAEITNSVINNGLTSKESEKILKELSTIVGRLSQPPNMSLKLGEILGKETDEKYRYESSLRAAQAGTEGRIEQRVEPIINVASARARRPEKDGREQ